MLTRPLSKNQPDLEHLKNGDPIGFTHKGKTMGKLVPDGDWVVIQPITDDNKIKVGNLVLCKSSRGLNLYLVKDIQTKNKKYLVGHLMSRDNEVVEESTLLGMSQGTRKS